MSDHRRIGRVLIIAIAAALVGGGPVSAQQADPATAAPAIEIVVSNAPIRHSAGLFTAAGETLNRGVDLGLDALFGTSARRRPRDRAARFARLWLVNLPIAAMTQTLSHDYGHFARVDEAGATSRSLRVTEWPWPVPIANSVEEAGDLGRFGTTALLAIVGGGEQAAHVRKQNLTDKIYSEDSADYFDWLLLGYAALDGPMYALTDLKGSYFASFDRFFAAPPGDFRQYAYALGAIDPASVLEFDRLRSQAVRLRRDALLNLADYALWAAVGRVGRFVATGERRTTSPTLRIGRLRLVPAAHASLSSIGPEKGVDLRLLTTAYLSHVDIRWIAPPIGRRLWGAGFDLRSRDTTRLRPELRVEAWQCRDSVSACLNGDRRLGLRFEAGARRRVPALGGRIDAALHLGYKTAGYQADAPQRAGLLFSLSATVR